MAAGTLVSFYDTFTILMTKIFLFLTKLRFLKSFSLDGTQRWCSGSSDYPGCGASVAECAVKAGRGHEGAAGDWGDCGIVSVKNVQWDLCVKVEIFLA